MIEKVSIYYILLFKYQIFFTLIVVTYNSKEIECRKVLIMNDTIRYICQSLAHIQLLCGRRAIYWNWLKRIAKFDLIFVLLHQNVVFWWLIVNTSWWSSHANIVLLSTIYFIHFIAWDWFALIPIYISICICGQ